MRVHLKGIHTVQAKGNTYYYAYRGGPRIKASPGSAAFIDEYRKALAARDKTKEGTIQALIEAFEASTDFTKKADSTRREYRNYLRLIGIEFGSMPIEALEDLDVRGVFKEWRDTLASTPRKADYAWSVLNRLFSWAKDRGKIRTNPCERGGRLYKAQRQEKIWTEDHIARFIAVAPYKLQLALVLALWTGQRKSDLLRLPELAYKDGKLRVFQSKGKTPVAIPVSPTLKEWLDSRPVTGTTILLGQRGPWTKWGFITEWKKACRKAEITDVTFHDLRGTAVTRLALAGCTVPEIASITGHSLEDVEHILQAHYLGGRVLLAEQAMAKLEKKEGRTNL